MPERFCLSGIFIYGSRGDCKTAVPPLGVIMKNRIDENALKIFYKLVYDTGHSFVGKSEVHLLVAPCAA